MKPFDAHRFKFPVLFESSHEIAVVKPARMATELTSDPKGTSLLSRVRKACAPGIVPKLPHRLDRIGRGIVVVALTDEAIAFHNEQIRERSWGKLYLARIHTPDERDVDRVLGPHKIHLRTLRGRAEVVRSGGKPALLDVLAISPRGRALTYALIRLRTGRFHQIRATLAHLGAPMVGDRLYGPPSDRESAFYLEHVALRFTPCGAGEPAVIHWRKDPDRHRLSREMRDTMDRVLDGWRDGREGLVWEEGAWRET